MLLVLAPSRNVAKGLYQIALYYISKDVVIFTLRNIFLHLKIGALFFSKEEGFHVIISCYFLKFIS